MNKMKLFALMAFAALTLTACTYEDNPVNNDDSGVIYVTENFSVAAETRVLTLDGVVGPVVVGEQVADWVTVTALENDGDGAPKVEIAVLANETGYNRIAVQSLQTEKVTVNLTINQGCINVDDPNEEMTDQPAFSPER